MFTWQARELIRIIKDAYPDWERFDHPDFVSQESDPIRRLSRQVRKQLMPKVVRALLSEGKYQACMDLIERAGKRSSLLWTGSAAQGDLSILYHPNLTAWEFCEQFRALVHEQRPSPDRLESFAEYCAEKRLPARWPFSTYFLFMLKPHAEIFVKPRQTQWFMRFMGLGDEYTIELSADMYERVKKELAWVKGGARWLQADRSGYRYD